MALSRAAEPDPDDFDNQDPGSAEARGGSSIDPQLAEAFLSMLDPGAKRFDFRTFDDVRDRKDPELVKMFTAKTLNEVLPELERLNRLGAGVYVVVNRTDGKGQKGRNVIGVRALVADADGVDPQPMIDGLKPHIIVGTSPGKYHLYWRVSDCNPKDVKRIQQAIIAKFGTDKKVIDLPRVLRLPGFFHRKDDPVLVDFDCRWMTEDDPLRQPYTVQDVVEGLGLDLISGKKERKSHAGLSDAAGASTEGRLPPPSDEMADVLKFLVRRHCFDRRSGTETDPDGKIVEVGWIDAGMALKVAYGDQDGSRLWALTHDDDRARADALTQWASFAAEAEPGQITVATLIKAAKDAGFPFSASKKTASSAPGFISYGPYTMTADPGLTKQKRGQNGLVLATWVSAPFEVLGACRDPNGSGWGKQLRFKDADNRVHTVHVQDSSLHGEPGMLCAGLANEGLSISRSGGKELVDYLSGVAVDARVTMVARTGWHEIGGQRAFVLPSETIASHIAERVELDGTATGPYDARGTLDDWKKGIGALAAGHSRAVFLISAALAGPLVDIVGGEGGGVHIFGTSSIGKSALLQAAASIWGRGAAPTGGSSGYVRSWRATANGLEGVAASATDTCLVLDELGVGEASDVAASIYSLANGQGKARAARDGSSREPKSWRVLILSSGEVPVETKLSEDRGRKTRAGQLVRLLGIPADRGLGFGAFDHAGDFDDAGKLADAIKIAAVTSYGTAGPEFVRRFIAKGLTSERLAGLKAFITEFVREVVEQEASEQTSRTAKKFALIALAGELATKLGVTPWAEGEARRAAVQAYKCWVEKRGGTGSHEDRQAVEQVRLLIEKHGDMRFVPIQQDADKKLPEYEGDQVRDRLGWRRGDGAEREWYVPPEVWKTEFCAGLDPVFVARTLNKFGMLRRQGGNNFASVVKIGGRSKRVYVLLASILDGGGPDG